MTDDPQRYWSIGEIAKEFGVTLRFLRFYEEKGRVRPLRVGSSRMYDAEQRDLVANIVKDRMLGLSGPGKLKKTRRANKVYADTTSMSLADIAEAIAGLHRRRDLIDAEIGALERSYAVRQGADPVLSSTRRSRDGAGE